MISEEILKMQTKLNQILEEFESKNLDLKRKEESITQLQKELEDKNRDIELSNNQLYSKREEMQQLQKSTEDRFRKMDAWEQELNKREEQIQTKMQQSKQEFKSRHSESIPSQNELENIHQVLESKNEEIEILRREIEETDREARAGRAALNWLKKDIERMMYELDERKSLLDDFESQIVDDRRNLADSRSEFCRWKEKLELLEDEIERRRVEVVEQEKTLNERVTSPLAGGIHNESAFEVDGEISSDVSGSDIETIEHHNVLDKTVQCAAIIQRGILKQINGSFAELIGFETDEIMNKSLFDFIAPEGLADLEKYYLNRLKGFDSYTYGTVFSTKDNGKILVEVSIKPTTYEGKKAEIAIIKELENK